MEGFIHIYNKKAEFSFSNSQIKNVINQLKQTEHIFKITRNEKIIGIYYTNEYDTYPYRNNDQFLFCPVGQFIEDKKNIQQKLFSPNISDRIDCIEKLAGAFLISTVNTLTNEIDIYTHVVRAESSFIYEDDRHTIVGTDPLLISTLSNNKLKPKFDPANFTSYFEQGYFADENTPFENVKALPENSHINISNLTKINNIDDTYKTAFTCSASDSLIEKINNDFTNAFKIVDDKNSLIRSGLTGGKDSRLILLALLENNFNVKTHTTGFPDHPDVTVAQELAKILNVTHVINERKLNKDNQLSINLEKRLIDITTASSGLLSAYDSVSTNKHFKNNINFNGVAASVISGGFNNFNHNIGSSTNAAALKKSLYKFEEYYIEKDNKYSTFLEDFSTQSDDYRTLLHLFFLKYRTGRWTSDSRVPKSYSSNSFSIFLDNQLTKSAMKLNMNDLRNEVIHYYLIKRLSPEILNVPFFNQRFAFEKKGPVSKDDYENWLTREPVYATSKIGSYNWRSLGNNDPNLVNAFKELILSSPNNIVFDNVNYDKIESLLNSKLTNRTNKFIWSLASMIKFSESFNNNSNSKNLKIKLKIPENSITNIVKPSKIIDLTNKFMVTNKSLTLNTSDNKITFNSEPGNSYLKTYKGGFNDVPDSINLTSAEKININTSINTNFNYVDTRMSIIFYTNEKRFKTVILKEPIHKDGNLIFMETIEIPKNAVFFRVAVLFKNHSSVDYILNYSYVDINF